MSESAAWAGICAAFVMSYVWLRTFAFIKRLFSLGIGRPDKGW